MSALSRFDVVDEKSLLRSLTRQKRFQALRAPSAFCLTDLVVLRGRFDVDEHALRRFCNAYQSLKPPFSIGLRSAKAEPFQSSGELKSGNFQDRH
jgi:hypothetical protein